MSQLSLLHIQACAIQSSSSQFSQVYTASCSDKNLWDIFSVFLFHPPFHCCSSTVVFIHPLTLPPHLTHPRLPPSILPPLAFVCGLLYTCLLMTHPLSPLHYLLLPSGYCQFFISMSQDILYTLHSDYQGI